MQQGDSYNIPIRISGDGGFVATPDTVADVRVMVKGVGERSYSKSTLTYENEEWLFPITQAQSLSLGSVVLVQAQVKFDDGSIVTTPKKAVTVGQSIIRDAWE